MRHSEYDKVVLTMARTRRFFTRYRDVRTLPWWAPLAERVGLALLIIWIMGMVWLYLGAPGLPR
jgi:hypothetical protein